MIGDFTLQFLIDGLPFVPFGHDHVSDTLTQNAWRCALEGSGSAPLMEDKRRLARDLDLNPPHRLRR